ncbi:uncharacterized protein YALI1_E03669g [Yarrowia lipolytica]|uniref:Uncharacterized protein n=1 Tax=Yarrowia lipolytica TaxID=4952 RepID=A0A1D8NGX3_YARLL|nr:hypothetical protein YALI1_E03669g [Yarrowia lipolytica]
MNRVIVDSNDDTCHRKYVPSTTCLWRHHPCPTRPDLLRASQGQVTWVTHIFAGVFQANNQLPERSLQLAVAATLQTELFLSDGVSGSAFQLFTRRENKSGRVEGSCVCRVRVVGFSRTTVTWQPQRDRCRWGLRKWGARRSGGRMTPVSGYGRQIFACRRKVRVPQDVQ